MLRPSSPGAVLLGPSVTSCLSRRTVGRSLDTEFQMLTPDEVRLHCPLLRTEDLLGGLWIPSDVTASPLKLTRTLADIAQQRGGRTEIGRRSGQV